ncbi:hypothetical protein Ae406Ps2_1762c [Pseudonocardia sp. Ae406_Ps2]|uniref:hypothetical protein n=1 Tax=unclassified Pseudonocardia TaxID=2619320 RepID=UPI00094ABACB|nr:MULTISPECIES: hypothetical protein [unclassified Pseudonocardia]KAA1019982.1 hypothetical protein FVA95_21795 [Pseudonocardia sp. EV170527-09]OLM01762.1 hypothetical protein Ae406Ps2_1762c [Pseudonocardia sp. Ae406_Ps2]OLM06456.1 hypothetical protein Ae331Ps2_4166 [Pseudonocardia sp. Ae331_Ps2]OLM23333.1 hypothetical protein Ae706Ps2_1766c [Pseudonocardia sp. Ae706_Ps2]OLM32388.1 hypothetical protein Ae717Ps2_3283c [Pseudonocardia sp. Ae717_Ps2]
MNPHLLEERVATVNGGRDLADPARARLRAHKATADACRRRAAERRAELERALAGGTTGDALDLMLELDALERVQDRIDNRLSELCDALTEPRTPRYGDAQPV